MSSNFTFIHNPKTGGETIQALLKINKNHSYAHKRKHELENKYSFTFVRHPVTRIISYYNHLLKHIYFNEIETNELNDKTWCYSFLSNHGKMGPAKHRVLAEQHDINSWIKIMLENVDEYLEPEYSPLTHQYLYAYDLDGKTQLVTDILKFENYQDELTNLLKKLKKEHLIQDIRKTNHSLSKNDKLTQESLDLLYNYFQKDFDLFNYDVNNY